REVNPISGERFARSAIRCCNVDTFSGSCAPGMFPSNESITWHPLPSPGSSREKFPCFSGTMECTDVLRPSRRASLPSLGATRCCACGFAPCGPGRPTAGPGFVHRSLLPVHGIGRRSGPPRFLGNPCVPTPCSPTPAGPTRQAIRRSRRGPRSDKNEDSHHEDFGAQSHGLGTRCLRFVPSIAARGRKTRFPLLATLRDGLGYPQDSDERFRVASYISSPFPRLSWRNASFSYQAEIRAHIAPIGPGKDMSIGELMELLQEHIGDNSPHVVITEPVTTLL